MVAPSQQLVRELIGDGLSPKAAQRIAQVITDQASSAGTSQLAWHGPFTVTKDTPNDTLLGFTLPADGSVLLVALIHTREPFDVWGILAAPDTADNVAGGWFDFTNSPPGWMSINASLSTGTHLTGGAGGITARIDSPLHFSDIGTPNTTGDADVFFLVFAPPA